MTSVSFTGDISFSKYFKDSWKNPDFIGNDIVDFLKNSDAVVANVESPYTGGDVEIDSSLTHASNPEAVCCLNKISANIWTMANNHILDCGDKGLLDTLKLAKENNVRTLGAGMNVSEAEKPVIIDSSGGIGIFGVTYKIGEHIVADENSSGCILIDDTKRIKKIIKKIKEKNRWCVIIAHAGEEFSSIPLLSVRKKYLKYLEWGADVVVGHHPHVTQSYETVGDKIIFYSLDNFIFDTDYQRIQNHTEYGMLIKIKFTEESFTWENMPVLIDRNTQSVIKGEKPDIFCDIAPKEYNLLRPLAVNKFFINNKKAHVFSDPDWKDYTALDWFKHYCSRLGMGAVIKMHIDELIYHLGLWKKADKKLYTYLINSEKVE